MTNHFFNMLYLLRYTGTENQIALAYLKGWNINQQKAYYYQTRKDEDRIVKQRLARIYSPVQIRL